MAYCRDPPPFQKIFSVFRNGVINYILQKLDRKADEAYLNAETEAEAEAGMEAGQGQEQEQEQEQNYGKHKLKGVLQNKFSLLLTLLW